MRDDTDGGATPGGERQPRGTAPLLDAPTPLAKRLNRNALTVAAVIMGMTVLTAVVVLTPSRTEAPVREGQRANEPAPSPGRPTFLDEPVRLDGQAGAIDSTHPAPDSASERADLLNRPMKHQPGYDFEEYASEDGPPLARPAAIPTPSTRELAYQAALKSSVSLDGRPIGSVAGAAASPSSEDRLVSLSDSLMTAALHPPAVGARPDATTPASRPGNAAHRAFLDESGRTSASAVQARREASGSAYTVGAGTVIPALLITAVNSDLPGDLVAQVSRDVYDSRTQRTLLVPRGTKLIGRYDNQIVAGQSRLLIAWTRLLFPDGRSLTLPGLALVDEQGRAGAPGNVNNHLTRVFGNAVLLSAIGAGAQLSQPQQTSPFGAPSVGQVAAGSLGQELSNVAMETVHRGMDIPPTITLDQGMPFNVFVNADIVFDMPYTESR